MAKAINDSVFDVSYGPVEPDNAPGAAGTYRDLKILQILDLRI